jgi:elongation of very long chain fatty acids protein 4
MAKILYIFYLSKILEFGDTIIMALRGSYRQISFLHVYHHSSIFLVWWVIIYFAPGGESYFSAALNSGIHVFMYAYYFWSASQPKEVADAPRKKPTWRQPEFYKKYITSSQMTQFCIMMLQASCTSLFVSVFFFFTVTTSPKYSNDFLLFSRVR